MQWDEDTAASRLWALMSELEARGWRLHLRNQTIISAASEAPSSVLHVWWCKAGAVQSAAVPMRNYWQSVGPVSRPGAGADIVHILSRGGYCASSDLDWWLPRGRGWAGRPPGPPGCPPRRRPRLSRSDSATPGSRLKHEEIRGYRKVFRGRLDKYYIFGL